MNRALFILTLGIVSFGAATQGWAQPVSDALFVDQFNAGNLFVSLVAGVVLAVGFQILLTILSVACGVSIFGNIRERFSSHVPKPYYGSGSSNPIMSISSGIGLWTLLTTSLSLFFASLLAVKISLIASDQIGMTLGLVIWAAFFITMTYFEMRSARSILGGIFSTVFTGLRSSVQLAQEMFGKSPAEKTVEAIRAELVGALHDPHLNKTINEYIKKFQASAFDWSKAKKELIKLFGDLEVRASMKEDGLERETFISLAQKHPHFSKEDVSKLGQIYDEVKDAAKAPGSGADKVLNAIGKLAPGSDDDSQQVREKFENYLRSAEVEALNPDSLKEDINKIVSDPKSTGQVVLNRIKLFDHPTIVSIISKKTNMSQEQANQVVNRVESVLEGIKEKTTKAGEKIEGAVSSKQEQAAGLKSGIEEKVRNYFASLQRSEFDYDRIKQDFEQIFHDPKASIDILKTRLKSYDRESLVALVRSWPNVSAEDAERIVNKIEEAKHNILRKAEEIEEKVKQKSQEAKETALRQAEHVRRTVVISAWWLFATAALSAFASAMGGVLALS
jgi:hypothetical protein